MFNKNMQNENNYFVILFGFCIFGHSLTRMHDELFMNSDCERRGERKTVNGECTVRERQTHAERALKWESRTLQGLYAYILFQTNKLECQTITEIMQTRSILKIK